jgi:hypothetical protein
VTLLQWHVHALFRLPTAILQLALVSHPFDGVRLIVKVAKSDSLLASEQRDVIVRHAQFNGITDEGDPVRRIRREPLEGLEYPEFFDREQGFRRAHVHEDARAGVPHAFENHCTKKPSHFFGGFPFEQVCSEKTAFHGDLVLHTLWGVRACGAPHLHPPPTAKRQRMTVVLFADDVHCPPQGERVVATPDKVSTELDFNSRLTLQNAREPWSDWTIFIVIRIVLGKD